MIGVVYDFGFDFIVYEIFVKIIINVYKFVSRYYYKFIVRYEYFWILFVFYIVKEGIYCIV